MIYITGDCHADFTRFSTDAFPEQKDMTKDDFVIICGDFGGIWADSRSERYWLDWLSKSLLRWFLWTEITRILTGYMVVSLMWWTIMVVKPIE